MICVTGNERGVDALARRLERTLDEADDVALAELRLDQLEPPLDDALALIARYGPRLVVCARASRQGGRFAGSERERLALLGRAGAAGAGWIDLEGDCGERELDQLRTAGARQVLLSWHQLDGDLTALQVRGRELEQRSAELLKLVLAVGDASELAPLRAASARLSRPRVVLGMGLAGQLSRARYRQFGSSWTYVAEDGERATAAGQLTLAEARAIGLPAELGADPPFFVLLGGPQIAHSPGPRVYNRLFRRRGLEHAYLLAQTARPVATIELLRELGAVGASVTMPCKRAVLELAEGDELTGAVGAANTLRFSGERTAATNTDVVGVREPLRRALERLEGAGGAKRARRVERASRALILGAGGAARAAAVACLQLQLEVCFAVRDPRRAVAMLPPALRDCTSVTGWDERGRTPCDVLVNATPLAGDRDPWPADQRLGARVVFDLALGAGDSRLLGRAQRAAALALHPEQMWYEQGSAQLRWIAGIEADPAELEELSRR